MIEVVVIDDSAFMRKALTIMMESDPDIRVTGTARDGEEGYNLVKKLKPHIVTLDLEMPRTNGFECLKLIMENEPTPVLIVSSLTTRGAKQTLEALDMGAVDYIPKTQSFVAIDITEIKPELIRKIKTIARKPSRSRRTTAGESKLHKAMAVAGKKTTVMDLSQFRFRCLAIGVSTGGPPVITSILKSLSGDFPLPILIAQHMPKEFTGSFSQRLDDNSAIAVKEAETGDIVTRGHAYVGRGGNHLRVKRLGVRVVCDVRPDPEDYLYHPSVDLLMSSAAEVFGSGVLGFILTGMGNDGVVGLKDVKRAGGKVLAQNEESCVVYGMPRAATAERLTDIELSIEGLIESLRTITV